jgi:trehalose 6-phosphate synthase
MQSKNWIQSRLDKTEASSCIIVSNRGPIEYERNGQDRYEAKFRSGGLVTGLLGAIRQRPVTWVALAVTEGDHMIMQTGDSKTITLPEPFTHTALRLVDVPQQMYHRHYNRICNQVLWFAQHSLLDPINRTTFSQRTRRDWEQGYCAINAALARAVIEELHLQDPQIPVIFLDYHLYLVPEQIRTYYPDARLGQTICIPWPDSRYLAMLPEYMVSSIYRSISANDSINFQTLHDAQNFLQGAERFLKGAQINWDQDSESGILQWENRYTSVQVYPIALSPDYICNVAESAEANELLRKLDEQTQFKNRGQLIVRVDRIDPTKNIIRGFQAYNLLLKAHPELQGQVTFLALLVPSRQSVAAYRLYERKVRHIIDRINTSYGQSHWQPIIAIFGHHRVRAIACLQYYDALLVNPLIDGMNLVVKEGGIINQRSGVIILSCTAGAHDKIGDHVLSIVPTDLESTARALYRALTMEPEERSYRANKIRDILMTEDAVQWLGVQIQNLLRIRR